MSLSEVVIEGTLKPDGTLELDQKPSLSPGRVQVTVKPLAPPAAGRRGLVEVMDEVRQGQRARGYQGRTRQEMQAEEKARQDEDEEYERRHEVAVTPAETVLEMSSDPAFRGDPSLVNPATRSLVLALSSSRQPMPGSP